ncbi:hypothetical protein R6Q59_018358 [Mikania micrantha]
MNVMDHKDEGSVGGLKHGVPDKRTRSVSPASRPLRPATTPLQLPAIGDDTPTASGDRRRLPNSFRRPARQRLPLRRPASLENGNRPSAAHLASWTAGPSVIPKMSVEARIATIGTSEYLRCDATFIKDKTTNGAIESRSEIGGPRWRESRAVVRITIGRVRWLLEAVEKSRSVVA